MNDNDWKTPKEMKETLGILAKNGDNRTLNKYVVMGKLEIKEFSRKIKLYRFPTIENGNNNNNNNNNEEFDMDFSETA
ncbi:MAG: hypothetical protein ACK5N8_06600 [Alphaproteobacteria bacterium]